MALKDQKSLYDLTSRGEVGNVVGTDESAYNRNYPGNVNNRPFVGINVENDFTFEGSEGINPDTEADKTSQLVRLLDKNVKSIREGDGYVPTPRARGRNSNDFKLDLDLEGVVKWPNNFLTNMNAGTPFTANGPYSDNKPEPDARF